MSEVVEGGGDEQMPRVIAEKCRQPLIIYCSLCGEPTHDPMIHAEADCVLFTYARERDTRQIVMHRWCALKMSEAFQQNKEATSE